MQHENKSWEIGLLKSDNVSSRTPWAPAASCRRIFISINTSAPWRSVAGLCHQSGECSSSLMLQHAVMRQDKQEATPHTAHLQLPWILDFKTLQPLWESRTDCKIYENSGVEAGHSVDIMQELEPSHRNQAAEVMYQAPVMLLGLSLASRYFHVYLFILFELLVDLSPGRNLLTSGT